MRAIHFHQMAVIAYFIQKQKLKIVKIPKSLKFQELMYVYLKQSLKSLEYSFWYKTCKHDLLQEFWTELHVQNFLVKSYAKWVKLAIIFKYEAKWKFFHFDPLTQTPQNGQTHSNKSSTTGLVLKGLTYFSLLNLTLYFIPFDHI